MSTPHKGKASPAMLRELWSVVLSALIGKVNKVKPSAEILFVARSFMRDNHYVGPVNTPKVRRQLDKLHADYITALSVALNSEKPSSSMLHETRLFLQQCKADREQMGGAGDSPTAIPSMPFKAHH